MAISVVQSAAFNAVSSGSFASPTTAGNTVVVAMITGSFSNVTITATGVTLGGAAGNFAQVTAVQSPYASGATQYIAVWADPNCAGGQTALAVSATNGSFGSGGTGFIAYEIAGLPSADFTDRISSASAGSGTAMSSGTTAQTSSAQEIWIGVLDAFGVLSSITPGFTNLTLTSGGSPYGAAGYWITTFRGGASYAATQGSSGPWASVAVAFGTPAAVRQPLVSQRGPRKRPRARLGPLAALSAGIQVYRPALTGPAIPVAVTAAAGTISGNVYVVQQVSGASQNDYGLATVNLSTTEHNTLVLLAGWDLSPGATTAAMPAAIVNDSAGNYWVHVATSSSGVSGSRSSAWVCTNAMAADWLSVSLTSFASSLAFTLIELANMPQYVSVDVSAANADASNTSLAVSPGSASVSDLAFSVFATGTTGLAPSTPAGWTALPTVSSGASSAAPVQIFPFWAPASAGTNLNTSWSVSRAAPLSGVSFAIKASPAAPVQANPNLPALKVEMGFGYTPGDPSQAPPVWTDVTARVIGKLGSDFLSSKMGREYELAQLEAGGMSIPLDNHDGTFTQGNTASPYYPDIVLKTPVHVSAFWADPGNAASGRWYHVGYGFVSHWPQDWPDLPQWTISGVAADDVVAAMASANMLAALDSDMLLDNPYVFIQASEQYTNFQNGLNPTYTNADAQGLLAANVSRVNQRAAMYVDGTYPVPGNTPPVAIAQTGQSTQMLGDQDSGFGTSQIGTAPTYPVSGPGVVYTDPNMPGPLSPNGVSVEFWLLISQTVASTSLQPTVFQAFGPPSAYKTANPSLSVKVLDFTGNNTLQVTLADGSTVSATFSVSTLPQQVVLTLTASSLSIYVNGALQATKSLTSSQTTVWYAWAGGCCNYAYQVGNLSVGNFTAFDFGIYGYVLGAQRIKSHYTTGQVGQQGVDATQRLAQILAWAGVPVARAGQVTFNGAAAAVTEGPAYSLEGQSAADGANQLAVNEAGMVFASPSGAAVFMHREALLNLASVQTFGDSITVASQIPFLQQSGFDYDDAYLSNQVIVILQVGPNTVLTVTANDFTSQQEYFLRSPQQTTIQTTSNLDAYMLAQWNAAKYSQPQVRVRTIVIDCAAYPAAFGPVLRLQQGQAATVTRTPIGGVPITEVCLVQRIEHHAGASAWQTSIQLSPYTPQNSVLQLDVPPYNVIGNVTLA